MITTKKIWRPQNVTEAWQIQKNLDSAEYCFVSGGTWLRTQWEAKLRSMPSHLISLEQIEEMRVVKERLSFGKREIVIGSQVTLATCIQHPLLQKYLPSLVSACRRIAAPSIRNQATIGGNISTVAGDTLPVWFVYKAKMRWFNGHEIETESIDQWILSLQAHNFERDPRILVDVIVEIDERQEDQFSFFTKVGRRETFTASLVTVAGKGRIDEGGKFQHVSLSAGGGKVPVRLLEAELELEGKEGCPSLFQAIYKQVMKQYNATSDPFASETYKKRMVANLIVSELIKQVEKWEAGGGMNVARS
ncbi:FAD binding domain-containing protein [Alkalihalobacillus sp. MEB130]|uniref:FAD binding domain-containing protein n=1 Tax=Alkalihalobacillus sp. MEB130 TaxID=2976704 RepID=UPI0028E092A2|nr:FAD binding domain-containing protein [Alkalihalobacillus sp. MEB130]MDT8860879.1 FAD binding domain-containing protein [Alkalihalobacillus sp. MEB130]